MKKLLALLGLALALVASLPAQETAPTQAPLRTSEQIDQLLGPIALYPDALIALILPASTASADIVLASRYLQTGNDPSAVDSQPWDDSVRALAHYPEIVKWMDQNLAWTKQVGDAFVAQPVDVMQSVQRLRAAARAAGTLTDTPQQQVVIEDDAISIVPAQPDVIYVPYYDPEVVYVMRSGYYGEPYLTFGMGFPVGSWLSFNLDWGHRRIWYVSRDERERYWRDHRDWRHPYFPGRPGYVRDPDRHPWRPVPDYVRSPQADLRRLRADVVRPTPLPSAPPRPPVRRQDAPPGRPDFRDRQPQADERGRQFNAPPNRPAVTAAPATAPTMPAVQPQTPPPTRRADVQRERNDGRQPDQRGRDFQGNPANRPPASAPPSVERAAPAPRQIPPGSPPPSQVRPQQPAPPPPTNRPSPPSEDDKKRTDRVQN